MNFCTEFDRSLAQHGPAAIFLRDHKQTLRCNFQWTRDVWEWSPGPHAIDWTWTLVRDRETRFVTLMLVTSPTLLTEHTKMDIRTYPSEEEALTALSEFGSPPIATDDW